MLKFDTTLLNKSTFRGVPFFTLNTELNGGHRLTTHSFIDSGTKTEGNGNSEKSFSIKGFIAGPEYITLKNNLIKAFDTKGSGVLIDTYYGEVTVLVESYKFSEESKAHGKATFSVNFTKESNEIVETEFVTLNRSEPLKQSSESDFNNKFNTNVGDDVLGLNVNSIKNFYSKSNDSMKFIDGASAEKQDLQNTINSAIRMTDVSSIKNKVSILANISSITSAMDRVYSSTKIKESDFVNISSSNNNAISSINSVDVTTLNEIEKKAHENDKAFIATMATARMQSLNEQLENIEFTTGDTFGETKTDVLEIFSILEDGMTDPTSLVNLYDYKTNYIKFIIQKYSKLQELKEDVQKDTIDIFTYTIKKYNDIQRSDEVMVNNDLIDPLFITGTLKVLDS